MFTSKQMWKLEEDAQIHKSDVPKGLHDYGV